MTRHVYWHPQTAAGQITITHATHDALMADIRAHLTAGQGFTLATLNLDHITKIRSDPAFRAAYQAHSHVVADGNPIVWLSHRAGRDVDLMPGSELIDPLCALAAETGTPVACLGSTADTLAAATRVLVARYPGLQVVAQIAPPFGLDVTGPEADAQIAQLAASGAGLCFMALGAPKQEMLAIRAAKELPQCGFISIGAGFDFIAGSQTRAPQWVRRLALEWLWRMLGNPKRLAKRYALCAAILPGLARDATRQRDKDTMP